MGAKEASLCREDTVGAFCLPPCSREHCSKGPGLRDRTRLAPSYRHGKAAPFLSGSGSATRTAQQSYAQGMGNDLFRTTTTVFHDNLGTKEGRGLAARPTNR
jgi:hypothetical protein